MSYRRKIRKIKNFIMKKYFLVLLTFPLFFFSCSSPTESEDSGTITFTIGESQTARWAPGPNGGLDPAIKAKLTHEIKLYNGDDYGTRIRTITLKPGKTSHTETNVPLGALRVEIRASLNGYDFAYGDEIITVVQGNNNKVDVTMERYERGIVLSEKSGSTYQFPALNQGYASSDLETLTVTVSNYAANDTGALLITLDPLTSSTNFALSATYITSIPRDTSVTFTVKPNDGLGAEYHTATVSVEGTAGSGISASFDVNFTVIGSPGTLTNPFLVANATDLSHVGNPDATTHVGWGLDKHYKQTANIDLASISDWAPIGIDFGHAFNGSYDGNGKTINNLKINAPGISDKGLFGYILDSATVQNVGLINCNIIGGYGVGGVVGTSDGILENCYVTGRVEGGIGVGGVVGMSDGTVRNCYTTSRVEGDSSVGGVIGVNNATVENCYATGDVSGTQTVGGVAGSNIDIGKVQNCYATGKVSGGNNVGGVVGINYITVQNCYATGVVSGSDRVGGVAGSNYGTIQNCVALNPSISNPVDFGRITGESASGTMSNNYGWENMKQGNTPTLITWTPTGATTVNGADVSASQYNSQGWWTTTNGPAWNLNTVWEWNSATKLPKLRGLAGQ